MLSGPAWLALEVKDIERVRPFYESTLGLPVVREDPAGGEVVFGAGPTDIVLREPGPVPRGGLHVHYAFSIPPASYDDWRAHLAGFDFSEHDFGAMSSLYCYDPAGNCVELGQDDSVAGGGTAESGLDGVEGPIAGVFEVVLEVEELDRAAHFYERLGFEVVDRGHERRRIRMSAGGLDIELWEPQLGLAEGRGGVHVDLGLETPDPADLATRLSGEACAVTDPGRGRRVRDRDGHWITLVPSG
ncbi:MAG: VOC family protein [Haloarculaceae archaeon]